MALNATFNKAKEGRHVRIIYIVVGDPVSTRGKVGIPVTGLILPHFCACPKTGSGGDER